ncbi:hypothetical protein C8R45DRAFT_921986 [Mycena sanguinolenta]|nr:hypothetical protein C8R45DRAFT_921986 [Mycena sanguinolenta]
MREMKVHSTREDKLHFSNVVGNFMLMFILHGDLFNRTSTLAASNIKRLHSLEQLNHLFGEGDEIPGTLCHRTTQLFIDGAERADDGEEGECGIAYSVVGYGGDKGEEERVQQMGHHQKRGILLCPGGDHMARERLNQPVVNGNVRKQVGTEANRPRTKSVHTILLVPPTSQAENEELILLLYSVRAPTDLAHISAYHTPSHAVPSTCIAATNPNS